MDLAAGASAIVLGRDVSVILQHFLELRESIRAVKDVPRCQSHAYPYTQDGEYKRKECLDPCSKNKEAR